MIKKCVGIHKNPNKLSLNEQAQYIIEKELSTSHHKNIVEIDPEISFKYNSLNICCGAQGTSKTVSVMKELIKLSAIPHDFHLMIYVTHTDSDDSFNSLMKYVNFPIVKTNYDDIEEEFERLLEFKEEYNKMVDGLKPKNKAILKPLFIKDFTRKRLHTFVLFDDCAFLFDKKYNGMFKTWFTELRHINATIFCNIQIWGSIDPKIKGLVSTVMLFKGFSRERVQYIFRQLSIDLSFEEFYKLYQKLKKYEKLLIDNRNNSVTIIL